MQNSIRKEDIMKKEIPSIVEVSEEEIVPEHAELSKEELTNLLIDNGLENEKLKKQIEDLKESQLKNSEEFEPNPIYRGTYREPLLR